MVTSEGRPKVYDVRERTYRYALEIIRFLEALPKDYVSQTIGKQLLRSATSIGANIIEAQAAGSKRDFANFYTYALKSANESKFWLKLLRDAGKASQEHVKVLFDETVELANIVASSILTMRGQRKF